MIDRSIISQVTVIFTDGDIKTYDITAKPSVAGYLAKEMKNTGVLSLWNDLESFVIPAKSIREFSIKRK